MAALAFLIPVAGLLALGMKLAAYRRDRVSAFLLIALPASALILTAALIGMVVEDWESSTDCVDACERDPALQLALDAAELATYGFAALLIASTARWMVVAVAARRSHGPSRPGAA